MQYDNVRQTSSQPAGLRNTSRGSPQLR